MSRILITGGTGMIGTALSKALVSKGDEVVILTRDAKKHQLGSRISYAAWDINKGMIDETAIANADAIVHLAGANVAEGRWTDKRKKEIVDSRVKSGELIVNSLSRIQNKVRTVISASAIGFYGPDPTIPNPKPFRETDPAFNDFLASVVQKWEAAISPVIQLNKRLVVLRTGIVLSNEGGAYAEFKKPMKFGMATALGSGKQVVSWIHIDDLVNMYIQAIENSQWNGIYNAVAPQPVSNKEMINAIRIEIKPSSLRVKVPEFVLKAMLGEMSSEVLKSTTVDASKIRGQGYHFLYPDITKAVKKLKAS